MSPAVPPLSPVLPVLQVQSLSFAYGSRRVVDLWSAALPAGLVWMRGPNGVGKSTRLKLLAGALAPSFGTAQIAGIDLLREPLAYRREVAWVAAEPPPFEHLSPSELFGFLRRLYPRADAAQWQAHVDGFGLQAFVRQPLRKLSTGTQHKAALAAALALNTRALLLDEPHNALDAASMDYWQSVLAGAVHWHDRLLLLVSHETPPVAAGLVLELG